MTLDPSDEALFQHYFSVLLRRLAYPIQVTRQDMIDLRKVAEIAVAEHRSLFPLPAKPECWRDIVKALYATHGTPENIAGVLSQHPAQAVYAEIERLMVAGALVERDDGSLATSAQYSALRLDARLEAIATVLGGAQ